MKKVKSWGTVLVLIIIFMWICFGAVPFFVPNVSDVTIRLLGVSFTAATALFTGVAFTVAYRSLIKQQENIREQQESLSKQIDLSVLSVFMDTMKIITYSKSFKQCQDYIFSEDFFHDREVIRLQLNKSMGEDVSLDDYSRVLDRNEGTPNIADNKKTELRQNRDKIKNYCMRMDYVGAVVINLNDKTAERMLLDLYGHTITKTYKRLAPLFNENNSEAKYKNYAHLNDIAIEYEKKHSNNDD